MYFSSVTEKKLRKFRNLIDGIFLLHDCAVNTCGMQYELVECLSMSSGFKEYTNKMPAAVRCSS
jgi:hypothetical protein